MRVRAVLDAEMHSALHAQEPRLGMPITRSADLALNLFLDSPQVERFIAICTRLWWSFFRVAMLSRPDSMGSRESTPERYPMTKRGRLERSAGDTE